MPLVNKKLKNTKQKGFKDHKLMTCLHSLCFRYETKPALSVPIHVVELTNVPPELRMSAAVPEEEETRKTTPKAKTKKKDWVST